MIMQSENTEIMSRKYSQNVSLLLGFLALGTVGCDEEQIAQLSPRIAVCSSAEKQDMVCNRMFDIGEVALMIDKNVRLFVHNQGNAALNLLAFESEDIGAKEIEFPITIPVNESAELALTISGKGLGNQSAKFVLENDDPSRTSFEITLLYTGVETPEPKIHLCNDSGGTDCHTELTVDFGTVRRSQKESRNLYLKNAGTADLEIVEVVHGGMSSSEDEFRLLTSTRPGVIEPGSIAAITAVYEPKDGIADSVQLVFRNNDPNNPECTATLVGTSSVNLPPNANAVERDSRRRNVDVFVEERVVIDGSMSADPEGDSVRFEWSLVGPMRSQAALDDTGAGLVSFVPDVAGSYRVELHTYDSLNQMSEVAAVVLVTALPRFRLSISAEWTTGGDVDLHLVPSTSELFSDQDCYFSNRSPDLGVIGNANDNPVLRDDSTEAPGREEIVYVHPPTGNYDLFLHYYDDYNLGPANVSVQVIFDNASTSALSEIVTLDSTCSVWRIGQISIPSDSIQLINASQNPICR